MRFLILPLLFFSFTSFSQTPALPAWEKKEIRFNTTEMKVKDDNTNKVVFDGVKSSMLQINDNEGQIINAGITVRVPGYFDMTGKITKSEFKIDKDWKSITYTASNEKKLCVVIITYRTEEQKPAFITVSSNDDWKGNKPKKYTFTLDGVK